MRNAYEFNGKNANFHDVARLDAMQQRIANQVVLFELALCQTGSEMRTVNGDVEFFEEVRQRADMVFVSVGQDDSGDVLAVLFEKLEIRNGNINAVRAFFRKSHARVEDEHLVLVAHGHTIHPKLADTAERNDL